LVETFLKDDYKQNLLRLIKVADEEEGNEVLAILPEKAMHLASVIFCLGSLLQWLCDSDFITTT
jgi:hypothetical protein